MKLLLIKPPFALDKFYFPHYVNEPLGTESLVSFLKPYHEVHYIDAIGQGWNNYWEVEKYPDAIFQGLTPEKIAQLTAKIKPKIIGLSWLFSTQNGSIRMTIEAIRKIDKEVPILVGGPHPSANINQVFEEFPEISLISFGEGEFTFKELLDYNLKNLDEINGLAFRQNGKIVINPPRKLTENLDIFPIPERNYINQYNRQRLYITIYSKLKKMGFKHLFNKKITKLLGALPFIDKIYYRLYNQKHKQFLPEADIVSSRGCPNHCTFCAIHNIWGHRWRMRTAKHVLEEIDFLVRKRGIKHINIQDDNFNVSKARTIEICKAIVERKYNITLLAHAGAFVPTLDEEVLTWLKKAGLSQLRMSIESGDQEILDKVIKKRIDLSKVKAIVDICKKIGIYTEGAFIFGVPGESVESMQRTLKYAEAVGFNRVIKFIYQPFPNTELYKICEENNYFTDDFDPKRIYITGNQCYIRTDKFTPEDVLKIVSRES